MVVDEEPSLASDLEELPAAPELSVGSDGTCLAVAIPKERLDEEVL